MRMRSIINGKVGLHPFTRALTLLWLLVVWGVLTVTGCSEDGVLDPTISSITEDPDALAAGPAAISRFAPTEVQQVGFVQYRGERRGAELGGDVTPAWSVE